VIAFQKNLVAAADAHHLVADFVEARGRVAGAEQGEDGETEQAAVQQAAEDWSGSRHSLLRRVSYTVFCAYEKIKTTALCAADSRGRLSPHSEFPESDI
jgi:hypothetical protein